MEALQMITEAVAYIRQRTDFSAEIGMILGSGLGEYANSIENPVSFSFEEIPHFPVSTVFGHSGRLILGKSQGKNVIVMQGRVHSYEGYSQALVTMPVRIMAKLGVQKLILTNAAGGVNPDWEAGTLMLIADHINFSGSNPLTGPNIDEFGVRFPDQSHVYAKEYRTILREKAQQAGIHLAEGVYMMFSGPNYETPAEIRMARIMGADAVGMSTVPESIVACHCGMSVLGISCITNKAAGILDKPLSHAEVMDVSNRVKKDFIKVLEITLSSVF